jgi:membrane protease YdiL (CAAX protease family)
LSPGRSTPAQICLTLVLASGLWFFAFRLGGPSFWIKISFSAVLLALAALFLQPGLFRRGRLDLGTMGLGLISALVLYLIFWLGRRVSILLFPFASDQIGGIYGLGSDFNPRLIPALLFFITGPAEEIYWRGFLQGQLTARLGGARAWLVTVALYAGVHLWTLNFMLIGAAAVAGAFWGLMYWRYSNLTANIISHAVWTAVVFSLFPLH